MVKPVEHKESFTVSGKLQRSFIFILLIAAAVTVMLRMAQLERNEALAQFPNQACVGIGVALRNGLDLKHYDIQASSQGPTMIYTNFDPDGFYGRHTCKTGRVVTSEKRNTDGSGATSGYELGASVSYFDSKEDAHAFAENNNRTRSWGVDERGQKNNIPQSSLFTFLVTDVDEPYFDSYTQREKFVVSLSVPCPMQDPSNLDASFDECNRKAQKTLKEFADSVQRTTSANPIF